MMFRNQKVAYIALKIGQMIIDASNGEEKFAIMMMKKRNYIANFIMS